MLLLGLGFCVCFYVLCFCLIMMHLVVSTSAVDCVKNSLQVTCFVLNGMLNIAYTWVTPVHVTDFKLSVSV